MTSLVTVGAILVVVVVVFIVAVNWHVVETAGFYALQAFAAVAGLVLIIVGIGMNSVFGGIVVLIGLVFGGAGAFNLIHGE